MVLDLARGGELFDRICAKEHYSEREAKEAFAQLAEAVGHCHRHEVVHRDLKPENVLYADVEGMPNGEQIKLVDFGLATILAPDHKVHAIVGSPGYVAADVLRGKGYDHAADLWSLGVVLYAIHRVQSKRHVAFKMHADASSALPDSRAGHALRLPAVPRPHGPEQGHQPDDIEGAVRIPRAVVARHLGRRQNSSAAPARARPGAPAVGGGGLRGHVDAGRRDGVAPHPVVLGELAPLQAQAQVQIRGPRGRRGAALGLAVRRPGDADAGEHIPRRQSGVFLVRAVLEPAATGGRAPGHRSDVALRSGRRRTYARGLSGGGVRLVRGL
mmetsp:Transcript_9454/g.28627  ORF Transcript_9454/g.28627 Transcript_9454/m.28627 type:complete len:328 (-) Transcript_9454:58-1041(-)